MSVSVKKISLALFALTSLFLASCAHHPDVRPGARGIHRVVISTGNKDDGSREAISQANSFCHEKKLSPAFVSEKTQYHGTMKESKYKSAKQATSVAKVAGGTLWALGGKSESSAGGLVGLGGLMGDAYLGNAYKVDMRFKCL